MSAFIFRSLILILSFYFSFEVLAECRDFAAITAANKKALSYFKGSKIFHAGIIQKVHHPSGKKEVASYVKVGQKYYSIFTLVDENCGVVYRKRTRQGD